MSERDDGGSGAARRRKEEAKAKEKEKAEEEVKRQEVQEEARLKKLQADRDALTAIGLETLSPHQRKRLNAILQEREAIWDRRERRREAAASSSHPGMGKKGRRGKRGGEGPLLLHSFREGVDS